MKLITRQEMQWMDRIAIQEYGIPSLVLMENAGKAIAGYIDQSFKASPKKSIFILCGKGNNAGDGFVIARHLLDRGYRVRVCLLFPHEEYQGDALVNLNRYEGEVCEAYNFRLFRGLRNELKTSSLIVDAIFGTGLDRPVRGLLAQVIREVNLLKKEVLAVDIPSGLCANTGKVLGAAISARYTCTLHLPKIGLLWGPDVGKVGELSVFPIGIPKFLENRIKRKIYLNHPQTFEKYFQARKKETYKHRYGHVLTLAGSRNKIGAALMTARASLRAGAGLSTLALPASAYEKINPRFAEIMFEPLPSEGDYFSLAAGDSVVKKLKNKQVMACGPGMGTSPALQKIMREVLEKTTVPLVLDADALNNLAGQKQYLLKSKFPVVLTPHLGEMERLCQVPKKELVLHKIKIIQAFAKKYKVHIILKGYRSLVANPQGEIYINSTGNPGMATAGTGDVLTGVLAGLIAQGIPFEKAVLAGIWIHGRAGDLVASHRGEAGMLAWDIAEKVPEVLKELVEQRIFS